MTINELRIGNLVLDDEGAISTVESIELCPRDLGYAIHLKDSFYITKIEDVKPIPLDEEWLVKLGFEKSTYEDVQWHEMDLNNDNYCDLYLMSGNKNGFLDVVLFPYEDWFRYRYVHQLQNIYFSLTGTELKVKL